LEMEMSTSEVDAFEDSFVTSPEVVIEPENGLQGLIELRETVPFSAMLCRIYTVNRFAASIGLPPELQHKMREAGRDIGKFTTQTCVSVTNQFTLAGSLYNPLRAQRPGMAVNAGTEALAAITEHLVDYQTENGCDFCEMHTLTASESWGRVTGKHAATAANFAKIADLHGLVLPYEHSHLETTCESLLDMLNVAVRWFDRMHELHPDARYPQGIWDTLSRAGASQNHSHMQTVLTRDQYLVGWERLVRGAQLYTQRHPADRYWRDLVYLHSCLNLSFRHGDAVAIISLTPRTPGHEIQILAPAPSVAFGQLWFAMLQVFIHALHSPVWSCGFALPAYGSEQHKNDSLPAIVTITSRGGQFDRVCDVSSNELHGQPVMSTDPFVTRGIIAAYLAANPGLLPQSPAEDITRNIRGVASDLECEMIPVMPN
jgi:hypothetical protein